MTLSYCRVSACERVRSSFQARHPSDPRRRATAGAGLWRSPAAWQSARCSRRQTPAAGVPGRQARGTGQPQFLDQPILQGLVRALDPAFGLARIGADDVDVERMQSPAKLGHPVAAQRPRMVDPEDAVLVAVERHRLAPGLQIGARRRGNRRRSTRSRQTADASPAGRVVDKHQQGALRPAILEPPVLAAVDLHQLADALAPRAWLVDALAPLLAVSPNPELDHPQPQRLAAERDVVNLAQFLSRQGRAKIPVVLANDRQRLAANGPGFAGCLGDRAASKSNPPDPRCGRPSAAEIPDAARAPRAAPPPGSSAVVDPGPAAPPAAQAPRRSSAVPSPQTPPEKPRGSVISNWHTGDILDRAST